MNIAESFGIMLVGMLVVFLGLIILIFCIQLMSVAFLKKEKQTTSPSNIPETVPEQTPLEEGESTQEDLSPSIVAAISAAISVVLQPGTKFLVKRIKRTNNIIQ